MSKPSTIAIDGPVASGKSTVGRRLAQRLGYRFVDTGAMYRALTWEAVRLGTDLDDEAALTRLAESTKIDIESSEGSSVTVNGRDVTAELRSEPVERGVSPVSRVAGVRAVLVKKQQAMAAGGKIVMAGRDIGTNVLTGADLKIYLDVSVEEQASRRYNELLELGEKVEYQAILDGLVRRDKIDSNRSANPLRPAEDAVRIDTDKMDENGVVEYIMTMVNER
jgi:cytidylate kinase